MDKNKTSVRCAKTCCTNNILKDCNLDLIAIDEHSECCEFSHGFSGTYRETPPECPQCKRLRKLQLKVEDKSTNDLSEIMVEASSVAAHCGVTMDELQKAIKLLDK